MSYTIDTIDYYYTIDVKLYNKCLDLRIIYIIITNVLLC